jgi:hypothetical protein
MGNEEYGRLTDEKSKRLRDRATTIRKANESFHSQKDLLYGVVNLIGQTRTLLEIDNPSDPLNKGINYQKGLLLERNLEKSIHKYIEWVRNAVSIREERLTEQADELENGRS